MSKDQRKNPEGYHDPTAYEAMKRCADPLHRLQGKRAKFVGGYFENLISASCDYYHERDIAHIEKTPEPMKVLKPAPKQPGKFIACFEKAAQPDYKGTIKGGRSIVFEAKHTDKDRIDYSRLSREQVDGLERHHKLGALSFVIVSFEFQDFYRIPWTVWRDMKDLYGRKYLKLDDLESYRLPALAMVIKFLSGIV